MRFAESEEEDTVLIGLLKNFRVLPGSAGILPAGKPAAHSAGWKPALPGGRMLKTLRQSDKTFENIYNSPHL
jgi:hypothetical protein